MANRTLEDRMASIIAASKAVKESTDKGELPPGFADFAKKQGLSDKEQAELLAFQYKIANGNTQIKKVDGGFDITFK